MSNISELVLKKVKESLLENKPKNLKLKKII